LLIAGNGDVGQVSYYKGKFEAYQRTYVLSDFVSVLPRFLYLILDGKLKDTVSKQKLGNTMPYIKMGMLTDFPVPVPPLPEQQRIVGILDEAFDDIATAKANAEKNLQNARALFESHLQSVFTQRGEGWVEKTVDQISINLDSKRIPITKSDRTSGEFPYYGASGIVDYVADYIFEGDTLLVSEDGANLLARSTPIAFSVSGKYWVNNHAHILKFENMATQRFVEFYLESIKLDEYITGAAQPKLNQKALNSIPISIPKSTDAQAQIVKSIELLSAETQRLESIE
jgi:type I restriction enzyme S subunit